MHYKNGAVVEYAGNRNGYGYRGRTSTEGKNREGVAVGAKR